MVVIPITDLLLTSLINAYDEESIKKIEGAGIIPIRLTNRILLFIGWNDRLAIFFKIGFNKEWIIRLKREFLSTTDP